MVTGIKMRGKKYAFSYRPGGEKGRVHTRRTFRTKKSAMRWLHKRLRRRGARWDTNWDPRVIRVPVVKTKQFMGGIGFYDHEKSKWRKPEKRPWHLK